MSSTQITHPNEAPDANAQLINHLRAETSVLGQSWNGNLRRFPVIFTDMVLVAALAAGGTATFTMSQVVSDQASIATFIENSPRAEVRSIEIEVQFGLGSFGSSARIFSALTKSVDTAIANGANFMLKPSGRIDMSTSLSVGAPPSWSRALQAGEYGVSQQIKPNPVYGATPRVEVRVEVTSSAAKAVGAPMGLVMLYLVVERL